MKYYLIFMISWYVIIGCNNEYDSIQSDLVDYVVNDSTFHRYLIIDKNSEDYTRIKNGDIDYQVSSLVNSSAFDYALSDCFSSLDNSDEIVKTFEMNLNDVDKRLEQFSKSDSASVQLFFTKRVMDVQGISVLYVNSEITPIKLIKEDPLNYVWNMNQGQFYLFKFKKNTNEIESVCKEIILNE